MAGKYAQQKIQTLSSFADFAEGGKFPEWPLEVFIEVSNICDLQCAMCHTFSALSTDRFFALKREDRGVIAYDTATKPLDEIMQHALIIHASGYGEPTIHPQYKELLTHLGQYEALVDFFTNGMHLDQAMCDTLVDQKIHCVSISFSGSTREQYENIYLGGDFQRVLDGIRRLSETKIAKKSQFPRIDINSLAFKHHIDDLPKFIDLMADHGANVIHVKPLRVYGNTIKELKNHESLLFSREESILELATRKAEARGIILASDPYENTRKKAQNFEKNFLTMTEEERDALREKYHIETIPLESLKALSFSKEKRESKIKNSKNKIPKTRKPLNTDEDKFIHFQGAPCLEPFKTMHIAFDGRVRPCCFSGSQDWLGNVNDLDAKTIWDETGYHTIRNRITEQKYHAEMCANCLKKSAYPKYHHLRSRYETYRRWYLERHGAEFPHDNDLAHRIECIGTVSEILASRAAHSP